LLDGITLLERKQQAIERYCRNTDGAEAIGPLMLVVARSIEEADELHHIIVGESFAGGRYTDRVLTFHNDAADEALETLESVDAADSPYRIVISVGVLKEGWDNKAVYVLVSMRASASTI
jgi:type III restriction enzyme